MYFAEICCKCWKDTRKVRIILQVYLYSSCSLQLTKISLKSFFFEIEFLGHKTYWNTFSWHVLTPSFSYLTECFLCTGERQTLYDLVEHYIPQFVNKTKQKQYEILVKGINTDQLEFNSTNMTITIVVQKFISSTKIFSENV